MLSVQRELNFEFFLIVLEIVSAYKVCLVGRVEKWEDRKWRDDEKDFNFPHFCLVRSEKVKGWKK